MNRLAWLLTTCFRVVATPMPRSRANPSSSPSLVDLLTAQVATFNIRTSATETA